MLETIEIATQAPYRVHVGPEALALAAQEQALALVVCDARVAPLWAAELGCSDALLLPEGEEAKTFAVLERVLEELAERGLDRSSSLLALGGGATGDLCGLAASLYMRGIACAQCPTTLLAQLDASVGGKTAVNLSSGKNLVGSFQQPTAVYADTRTLATLDPEQHRSGLGEALKTALISGEPLLVRLEQSAASILPGGDVDALGCLVADCVRAKGAVVVGDERDCGDRMVLNLGHTFAHAIEHGAGFGLVPHGIAVAVGIFMSIEASRMLGCLKDASLPERVASLASRLELPHDLNELRHSYGAALEPSALKQAMLRDKKGRDRSPRFVLPVEPGAVELDAELPDSLLELLLG